jgi:uncharacterized membrane protein YfcA
VTVDAGALVVAELGVFLIAFMRGAFGGGFAIIGIPLLSLAMDPIQAGGLLAPLFIAMDVVAIRYWRPATWSKPDLVVLIPTLLAGIAAGFWLLNELDRRAVAILMAVVTLAFAAFGFRGAGDASERPRSLRRAGVAGAAAGVTTMVAHSGGPPLAMYLLPLGLPKAVYAGTTSIFFTVANVAKAGPWLLVAHLDRPLLTVMGLCVPAVPLGVWAGWRLHQGLNQRQLYRACYVLLVVTALKLLWDGVSGYLR